MRVMFAEQDSPKPSKQQWQVSAGGSGPAGVLQPKAASPAQGCPVREASGTEEH